jgi:CCR4-NOT complex subunit CAF16
LDIVDETVTMTDPKAPKEIAPSIDVTNLSYAFPDGSAGLKDVFLNLPPGSRTLLIGGVPIPTLV